MIGPVGSTVFVNQQTATVASAHGNQNNKFDLQNVMSQSIVNEKEKQILEVRPTEENQEVDPDREHQKNEADQETSRIKYDEDKDEDKESENNISEFHLDIIV